METNQMSATLQVPSSTPAELWDACQDNLQRKVVLGDMVNYDDFRSPPLILHHQTEWVGFCYVSEKKQICEVMVEQSIP